MTLILLIIIANQSAWLDFDFAQVPHQKGGRWGKMKEGGCIIGHGSGVLTGHLGMGHGTSLASYPGSRFLINCIGASTSLLRLIREPGNEARDILTPSASGWKAGTGDLHKEQL